MFSVVCYVPQMAAVSSDTGSRPARETASGLHRDAVIDYQALLAPRIPIVEATQIQLQPGCSPPDLTLFSSDSVWAVLADVHVASVGVTVMDPDYFSFALWAGEEECRLNGEPARATTLYAQGHQDGFYISGKARRTLGVAVRRSDLIEALAALRGVGPEDVALDDSCLELGREAAARFRKSLVDLVTRPLRDVSASPPEAETSNVSASIFGALVDAYLHARPELRQRPKAYAPERIVRAAEERFFAAQAAGAPISLPDLCAAARVSQRTLYRAFHTVCGEPPLAYFHKRKLTNARAMLLHARPERGAVKAAAIDAGLTELGRFSVQYRRLFGECPSTTLNKSVVL